MFSVCEFCSSKLAVVHCDADSADLCLFCDRQVHSANALALNHTRRWICHLCGQSPASFLLSMSNDDPLLLCTNCTDSENSNTNCSIQGFSGCPSPASMAYDLGLDDSLLSYCYYSGDERKQRKKEVREQLAEVARTSIDVDTVELRPKTPPPSTVDADDDEFKHYFTASACEEDLLWDYNPTYDSSLMWEFRLEGSKGCQESCLLVPKHEVPTAFDDYGATQDNRLNRPLATGSPRSYELRNEPNTKEDMEIMAQNRGSAMLCYMEKRKTRSYNKNIRYESRKARADTRKRVKGRFVKSSEA